MENIEQLYAFSYQPSTPLTSTNGWQIYDPQREYHRMGIDQRNKLWRLSSINKDFEFSSTYPQTLVVPARISDNVLKHIGKFRSKSRIPVLSYVHRKNGASLTRASQPMCGLTRKRSLQDEKLVEAIFNSVVISPSPPSRPHMIADARPSNNALAQAAMGAGTESSDIYHGCQIEYLDVENIHVVRDSMNKLMNAIVAAETEPISRSALDRSGWLKHIKCLMDGTLSIVKSIHVHNNSVLVHCSDGWDRTAQFCSLASLCLDSYYRTIEGFQVLVEKEWVSFGHKFSDRCGHLSNGIESGGGAGTGSVRQQFQTASKTVSKSISSFLRSETPQTTVSASGNVPPSTRFTNYSAVTGLASSEMATTNNIAPREVSPVFTQFLDCVYQLWTQFPTHFEFTERFLIQLNNHVYSCQFGNFLFNCEYERKSYRKKANSRDPGVPIQECTYSVWDWFNSNKEEFISQLYISPDERLKLQQEYVAATNNTDDLPPESDVGRKVMGLGTGEMLSSGKPGTTNESGDILFPSSFDLKYWSGLYVRGEEELNLLEPISTTPTVDDSSTSSMERNTRLPVEFDASPHEVPRFDTEETNSSSIQTPTISVTLTNIAASAHSKLLEGISTISAGFHAPSSTTSLQRTGSRDIIGKWGLPAGIEENPWNSNGNSSNISSVPQSANMSDQWGSMDRLSPTHWSAPSERSRHNSAPIVDTQLRDTFNHANLEETVVTNVWESNGVDPLGVATSKDDVIVRPLGGWEAKLANKRAAREAAGF
ncbi:hypothetical protein HK096_007737 [Nowakowskiella sp. JEL0078]|nr:hypothetical protein HK096_007737 [Nowakowskiella sp. JEL0078]